VPLAYGVVTFDSVPSRALAGAAEGLEIGDRTSETPGLRLRVSPPSEETVAGSGRKVRVGLLRVRVEGAGEVGVLAPDVGAGVYRRVRSMDG
jgi:hypothetical protein